MSLEAYLDPRRRRVEEALDRLLPRPSGPSATVARAMRYAVLGGGKRLRPLLAIATCEACGGSIDAVLDPAAALEMLHTYSLVHDDLPSMDDDDLRRGRPTVHRAFGEAEAVLAGDALLTLAFEVLASAPPGGAFAGRRAEAVAVVARRAGVDGMVGGQMADLEAERTDVDPSRLEWIHRHKTGALMAASVLVGAIHGGASETERRDLERYGLETGLAFQIADDVLDATSSPEILGKTPGKDLDAGKATYAAALGVDASRAEAARRVGIALLALKSSGRATEPLRALARFAVERSR
ncbi:MAG: polyprenyl synthetase family protein [Acidobacteriia bacterium]|nr:polyprenyl synthetase family protein [Terriglobia bacterium]